MPGGMPGRSIAEVGRGGADRGEALRGHTGVQDSNRLTDAVRDGAAQRPALATSSTVPAIGCESTSQGLDGVPGPRSASASFRPRRLGGEDQARPRLRERRSPKGTPRVVADTLAGSGQHHMTVAASERRASRHAPRNGAGGTTPAWPRNTKRQVVSA